ncbi:MAG: hypothetical protein IJN29_11980 [Akkermansia sp.]|nr:hypothetical protein [Akkermansia sp.]
MKSSLILVAGGALLLSACTPTKKPATKPVATPPAVTTAANPYVQTAANAGAAAVQPAAPAQPTTYTPSSYLPQAPAQPTPQVVYTVDPMTGQPIAVQQPQQQLYVMDAATGQLVPVQAPVVAPQPAPAYTTDPMTGQPISAQQQPGMSDITGMAPTGPEMQGMGMPTQPTQTASTPGAAANYAVQLINGTTGRLFLEVFDDSDNVFPVGYMFAGQNISTPPSEPRNIQGQLTVVVRDPDTPDGKELRRYKVMPPANYANKTIGITILPGGRYRASLDGQVYYTSPDPKAATPAAPATPAPAAPAATSATPAPAAAPAPAPAADPATAPTQIL